MNIVEPTVKTNEYGRKVYTFPILAMGKPRMTQRDKWYKREVTDRYWIYKRDLNTLANILKFNPQEVLSNYYHVIFYLPMPQSWSKKLQSQMAYTLHRSKPDKDNLEKAFLDCLCENDSFVADSRVSKYWCLQGEERIVLVT